MNSNFVVRKATLESRMPPTKVLCSNWQIALQTLSSFAAPQCEKIRLALDWGRDWCCPSFGRPKDAQLRQGATRMLEVGLGRHQVRGTVWSFLGKAGDFWQKSAGKCRPIGKLSLFRGALRRGLSPRIGL